MATAQVAAIPRQAPFPFKTAEEKVKQINLELIKFKLVEEVEGWTPKRANDGEIHYRRFLILNLLYPGGNIVPTKEVDAFWHQHILDTRKYAADCETVFGYFLHHFPYFGLRGPQDAKNLKRAFTRTNLLLLQHFGEVSTKPKQPTPCKPTPPEMKAETAADCDSSACSGQPSCGSSCTGMIV